MNHYLAYLALVVLFLSPVTANAVYGKTQHELKQMISEHTTKAKYDLPHSQGKVFYRLDDYLAHLQKMSMQDRPFYEKTGPDQFRLNTGRGGRRNPPSFYPEGIIAQIRFQRITQSGSDI